MVAEMRERIIDPEYRQKLLDLARKACERKGISIGYLGALIVKDGDFFSNLEAGGGCRADTLVKAEDWLLRDARG